MAKSRENRQLTVSTIIEGKSDSEDKIFKAGWRILQEDNAAC